MHRRRNLILNLAILVSIAATCAGLWAYFNRPVAVPAWPENVWGYSFSPFRAGQDPTRNVYPSEQEIAADIEMLAEQTNRCGPTRCATASAKSRGSRRNTG